MSHNLLSYDQSDLAAMRGVILSCWERWSIITTSSSFWWSLVTFDDCLSLFVRFLPSLIGWIDPCFLTHEYLTRWDKMRDEMMRWEMIRSIFYHINLSTYQPSSYHTSSWKIISCHLTNLFLRDKRDIGWSSNLPSLISSHLSSNSHHDNINNFLNSFSHFWFNRFLRLMIK